MTPAPSGEGVSGCRCDDYGECCSNKEDTETEIEFRFQVPRLPDAASETRFRWVSGYFKCQI